MWVIWYAYIVTTDVWEPIIAWICQGFTKFQLHDFASPRDIYGRPEQKKLFCHYYVHQTKFPIITLQTLSDLSLFEIKLLP